MALRAFLLRAEQQYQRGILAEESMNALQIVNRRLPRPVCHTVECATELCEILFGKVYTAGEYTPPVYNSALTGSVMS